MGRLSVFGTVVILNVSYHCYSSCMLEKDLASSPGVLHTPPVGSNPFESSKSEDEEEDEEALTLRDEEEGPFLETDLADSDGYITPGACPPVGLDDKEPDVFGFPPSRADEALGICEYAPCWFRWIAQQTQQYKAISKLFENCSN